MLMLEVIIGAGVVMNENMIIKHGLENRHNVEPAKDFLSHGGMKRRYGSEVHALRVITHVDNVSLCGEKRYISY